MGCCASVFSNATDGDEERLKRYNPDIESSADDQSDAASSDSQSCAVAIRKPSTRRSLEIQLTQREIHHAVDVILAKSAMADAAVAAVLYRNRQRVALVGRLCNTAEADAARRAFWHAGQLKWHEAIDVVHHRWGRFAYDLCLHGGNNARQEMGYISSMFDAWAYASSEIGWKSNSTSWLALHFLAMQHPGNEFMNGRFRNLRQGNRALLSKKLGVTKARVKEMQMMPEALCRVRKRSEAFDDKYTHERWNPPVRRKTMRRYVYQYIHDFYKAVGVVTPTAERVIATGRVVLLAPPLADDDRRGDGPAVAEYAMDETPPSMTTLPTVAVVYDVEWTKGYPPPSEDVIDAITTLHQRLSRIEPSRDGNTRTMVVLINKLLCECGLQPAVFDFPDAASFWTHDEWRKEVCDAIKRNTAGTVIAEAPLPHEWLITERAARLQQLERDAGQLNEFNTKTATTTEITQWQRRPWFDDDLRSRRQRASHSQHQQCSYRPSRMDFEPPLEPDPQQRNAYFEN